MTKEEIVQELEFILDTADSDEDVAQKLTILVNELTKD